MSSNGIGQNDLERDLGPVITAFEASLDPRTTNDVRKEALKYIENLTSKREAPQYGISLARDRARPQAIRYFGLQMLEFALRYRFDRYDESATEHMIDWITDLASDCTDSDPSFIRNKIAQLWTECAERVWPIRWAEMDAALGKLWTESHQKSQVTGILLVLDVLEMMSSDISGEENLTALRTDDLGGAFSSILVSQQFQEDYTQGRVNSWTNTDFRWERDGWLSRLAAIIQTCAMQLHSSQSVDSVQPAETCIMHALAALRSMAAWLDVLAVVQADVLKAAVSVLQLSSTTLRCSAAELLRVIVSRSSTTSAGPATIRYLLDVTQISQLARAFSNQNELGRTQDDLLQLQKKTSELLGELLEVAMVHADAALSSSGHKDFLTLLLHVLQNENLIVSIPVLHGWTKMLASKDGRMRGQAENALGVLMDVCASRLLDFEALGEDFDHPIVAALFDDFDTMPERHAFLANYRRYCVSVIEQVARQKPTETVEFALARTQSVLKTGPYTRSTGLSPQAYSKKALAVLQAQAQFSADHSMIAGLFKGSRTRSGPRRASTDSSEHWTSIHSMLEQFCHDASTMAIEDPEVQGGLVILLSSIVRNSQATPDTVLKVTKHILDINIDDTDANEAFKDCRKSFESLRAVELQKIALSHADTLLTVYDELQTAVSRLCIEQPSITRVTYGYQALLLITILRAVAVPEDARTEQLQQLIQPLSSAWTSPMIARAISSFENFKECLGLVNLTEFYEEHNFAQAEDWAAHQLDDQGKTRLTLIKDRLDSLPFRMTRALLGATTERLEAGTDVYDTACRLWSTVIPTILPPLLQMIAQAQLFTNPSQWSSLSPEMQAVMKRSLQDRFWQSGISNESRDDFYARVSGSKTSYEGFASAVRGSIRNTREHGYHILFLCSKFEEQFYGLHDLPQPLADALFGNAETLSANHLNPLISLMTGLTQGCPPHHRARFLPPLLRQMFQKLDQKIAGDWETTTSATEGAQEDDDDLSEEMRLESVLRQVTYAAISFVAFLLEPDRTVSGRQQAVRPTLSELVLSDTTVLEPLILFCTHALRMRDTRSCTTICRILISILPHFQGESEPASQVREFLSTEVLKAGITSLNEQYFADMQKDLAALLAQIVILYSLKTPTPRAILLSLPDMQEHKVDEAILALRNANSTKQQRALVLKLLENVRGVSIHDMGKVRQPKANGRSSRKNGVQAQYMEIDQRPAIINGEETGLDGVADLFGGQ